MSERCETCDRPDATIEDWNRDRHEWVREHKCNDDDCAGECLCWGGTQCDSVEVDWRGRALAAERERDNGRKQAAQIRDATIDLCIAALDSQPLLGCSYRFVLGALKEIAKATNAAPPPPTSPLVVKEVVK